MDTQTKIKRVKTEQEIAIINETKRRLKIVRTVQTMSDVEKDEWITAINKSREQTGTASEDGLDPLEKI